MTGTMFIATNAMASDNGGIYKVTVTNITQGEIFTPIMVASHKRGLKLFDLGYTASNELEQLAEGGDTGPISTMLMNNGAYDVVTGEGVLAPGASTTITVNAKNERGYISVASMLVPSNDAFFALNGVRGPGKNKTRTFMVPAYDAGSEINDELCVNIPGPPFLCAGEGYNLASGEGYVYIHPGILGGGDLSPVSQAWKNPVAKVTITFVSN
ncbi:MAG: spondin domain-containing protein [Gammaproteobacteria bacterium]|nr:spondin domain-containing protein [Gammaproteobacteria bacterium]